MAEIPSAYFPNGLKRLHSFILSLQVKWVSKITASKDESRSHWQLKDYKTFSPSTDWDTANFENAQAIQDYPLQSGTVKCEKNNPS